MQENQAALITSNSNRLYFTGFNSSAGTVVITKKHSWFLIDFRYYEKAKATVKHMDVILSTRLYEKIKEILLSDNIDEIMIESKAVNISYFSALCSALENFKLNQSNTLSNNIEALRRIKSEKELENIKKAQTLTDNTFSYILDRISEGKTEKEIALEMEFYMRKNGSEGAAFDFIVVSGKNSSLPHGVPTDKPIENGDFITMDFGAIINGYRSDMTRTVVLGAADNFQKEIYQTVLSAQIAAFDSIKPPILCRDIDKIARDIISNAGYGDCFGHGLGHSVGIDIHESPAFNTRDTTPLEKGMVITVEPGIYLENKFGVRIEDMIYVTENGIINLTQSPKELIIV